MYHPGDLRVSKQERILFITRICDIPERETSATIHEKMLPSSSFIIFFSFLWLFIHILSSLCCCDFETRNSYFHILRRSLWVLSKSLLPSSLNNFLLSSCTLNTWWESYFLSYPSVTLKYRICALPQKCVHFKRHCTWINHALWIHKIHWKLLACFAWERLTSEFVFDFLKKM